MGLLNDGPESFENVAVAFPGFMMSNVSIIGLKSFISLACDFFWACIKHGVFP